MNAVRFAPSPTGYLHIGGARTAIFNWLFAKKHNAAFLLRIEDTDTERSTPAATETIFQGLRWLGLQWDGEPVYQAQRTARHAEQVQHLLESDKAYRCFCSAEKLDAERRRAIADKRTYLYDRACLRLSGSEVAQKLAAREPFVVRFQVPDRAVTFADHVHGDVSVDGSLISDFVLQRSNGSPVYQLAVVVDDHDMGITHVIRGDDHLSNTPKQILLYEALGWSIPEFVHLPLIHGMDGKKLSKRHGATAVHEYAGKGIVPDALFNFLALLGWSSGDDRELFSRDELIQEFSLAGLAKKSAIFDETKLFWMNGQYLNKMAASELLDLLIPRIQQEGLASKHTLEQDRQRIVSFIELAKPRARVLWDIVDLLTYYFADPQHFDEAGVAKFWHDEVVADQLAKLSAALQNIEVWREEEIERVVRTTADELGLSAGKLIHPARLALTGRTNSPGLFEMMSVFGRETVLRRLDAAANSIRARLRG